MKIQTWLRLMVVTAAIAAAAYVSPASATPFGFIGARAVGMGGAGVAATEDAQAIYWNPAGLALHEVEAGARHLALCNYVGFLSRADAPEATQALLEVTRRVRASFPDLAAQPRLLE